MTSFLRSFFSKAAQPAPVVAAPELSEKAAPVKLPCRCADAATPVHSYMYQMVEMGITRLFMEKDIFNKIPEEGISVKDLADKIGAEFNLMERMIKVLVASRVFKSPSPGQIKHTDTSKMFGTKMGHLYFTHVFDYFTVSAAKWIEYFDTHGLQEPKKSSESPFGFGIGYPDKSLYEILEILPPHRAIAFNATMAMGIGEMSILDMYDFTWIGEAAKRSGNEARTVFVDVGGGKGQALRAILEANPEIPAERCVVEDREETIKEAEADSEGTDFARVKKVPISFFDEQPVKGQQSNNSNELFLLIILRLTCLLYSPSFE